MAAMPSVGRIKQLSVVALAAAFLGVTASSASANDVWLWACHDPNGAALPELGGQAVPDDADKSCTQADPAFNTFADGMRTSLPAEGDGSFWWFYAPPSTVIQELKLYRQTSALGAGQRYELRTSTGELRAADRRRSTGRGPSRRPLRPPTSATTFASA